MKKLLIVFLMTTMMLAFSATAYAGDKEDCEFPDPITKTRMRN